MHASSGASDGGTWEGKTNNNTPDWQQPVSRANTGRRVAPSLAILRAGQFVSRAPTTMHSFIAGKSTADAADSHKGPQKNP